MDYSGNKNDVTVLTHKIFLRETCSGEFDDISDILGSKWCNLENFKQAELNAKEQCADCNENPVAFGNLGNKNILLRWRKKKIQEFLLTREWVLRWVVGKCVLK